MQGQWEIGKRLEANRGYGYGALQWDTVEALTGEIGDLFQMQSDGVRR